jgi:hypothetical protein
MKSGDPGPTEPELIEPELAVELAAPPRLATLGPLELPPQPASSKTTATVVTEAGMSVRWRTPVGRFSRAVYDLISRVQARRL